MSTRLIRFYRSKEGLSDFVFEFVDRGTHLDVYCRSRPSLNGQDSDVHKTHIFSDDRLCFASGKEPRTQQRAEALAAQWAEYFLTYRQTGISQS